MKIILTHPSHIQNILNKNPKHERPLFFTNISWTLYIFVVLIINVINHIEKRVI